MLAHRVVSDGIKYRVQWLGKTLFLRRLKWYWLRQYSGDLISEFDTRPEAERAIVESIKQQKAKKQGFVPYRPAEGYNELQ